MRRNIQRIVIIVLAIFMAQGCKTSKKGSGYIKVDAQARNAELQINLKSPINTADKDELKRSVYADKTYFFVQNKENQFKDNAPFIQLLDNGTRERLWFTSSRADSLFYGAKPTNFYQQVYYSEREIGEGKCAADGWGQPKLFTVTTDNPMFGELILAFNQATKGAVAIAGNTIILSCDQLNVGAEREFKQLWSVDIAGNTFINPKPLTTISNGKTWETQPSLSVNGKHLFFVSNRLVNNNLTYENNKTGTDLNIFYSFNDNGQWGTPVLVQELYSDKNEITPHLSVKGNTLFFSSDKDGDYEIYEIDVKLDDVNGGYVMDKSTLKKFDSPMIDICSEGKESFVLNGSYNQKYPYFYFNPVNKKSPQAFFWASDNPNGMGSYDIYGCAIPFRVEYNVVLADASLQGGNETIEYPVIAISGALNQSDEKQKAKYKLYSGLKYQVRGGSTASKEKGTFHCDCDDKYIFVGYSILKNEKNPEDKEMHSSVMSGPWVNSKLTAAFEFLPVFNVLSDTVVNDTIYITKAWEKKPPCPGVLDIPQKHRAIPYFQTGFWEVNTSENLKRDLTQLHEGFDVSPNNDIYNPQGKFKFNGSDYRVNDWESLIYPVNTKDNRGYSIAHARWIELHPNNTYWGDHPGYTWTDQRAKGRKDRISQYVDYAKKVDENLKMLTDTIKDSYISFLDLHKSAKPKLLIEIFAVSDQREILRGWYIGDTVAYRGTEFLSNGTFKTEQVKIIPPRVNEATKTIEEIVNCTIDLNDKGNNGTKLGINSDKTELNTNLSRLRAWYGYKEIYKRLADSENFNKYLLRGKVALPDNNVAYEDADIIIITRGRRIDVINPKNPYPAANNPSGNGFYDYDQVRRVEIRIRLMFDNKDELSKGFCCYGSK